MATKKTSPKKKTAAKPKKAVKRRATQMRGGVVVHGNIIAKRDVIMRDQRNDNRSLAEADRRNVDRPAELPGRAMWGCARGCPNPPLTRRVSWAADRP